MSAAGRLAAFAALLAVVFAAATVAGAEIDPGVDDDAGHDSGDEEMKTHEQTTAGSSGSLPGLAVAQSGYRLEPERTDLPASEDAPYRFRIVEESGEVVRDFDLEHERRMHLIVVRRDFERFQHLHPRQREDGSWETTVDLSAAGTYRAFADFSTGGDSLTLATDLFVPGEFEPRDLPPAAGTADAGDGYEVVLDSNPAEGGATSPESFTVLHNGREVPEVEPYLGADGHLVALREHDQAFLHTHPEGEPGGPGPIVFDVEYPTSGRYRLFLQFKHAGKVRTAAFTREIGETTANPAAPAEPAHGHEEGDDGGH